MTAAVATAFTSTMASLTGNTGGAVQSLPAVTQAGGRERVFIAPIVMAGQASGTTFGVARLPLYCAITGMTLVTDTSLGSATVAIGDASNTTLYMAAQTLTSTNTPARVGLASAHGGAITTGYDCISGAATKTYEDITITVGAAALPSSGNLVLIIEYVID